MAPPLSRRGRADASMTKKTKRPTTQDELSSSSASSTDDDTSPDETTPPRSSKEDVIIMMLADLQRSHRKMRKELKKLSGRYDSLSKQLELHNNGTSGDGGSTAQRSSILYQVQPGIYKLVFTSGNIGVPFENGKKKNIEYKIEMGQTIDITVALVDRTDRDNETVENGHLALVRVELFVLDDKAFNQHVHQSNYWSTEELERCIRTTTTKQNPAQRKSVKVSDSQFNLIRGVGSHRCSINVNSGNSKFRLAVRVVSSIKERVLEGFSNPFYVRDLAKPNKQKQKRPMMDSNQAARITMNTSEEQPNLPCQGSSTMYFAQQSTTNAEHTMTGQCQAALRSQMRAETMNNQAANTSEEQPQLPVPCHGSNATYSAQPRITSAELAFPVQYQSTLHSHPTWAQPMNSQSAMYTSEVQRQPIDRGNSAVYSTPQYTSLDQALSTGHYQFSHHWPPLPQATSNQIDAACNLHHQGANNNYFPFHLSPVKRPSVSRTLRLSKMSLVDENMNIKFHMLEAITKKFAPSSSPLLELPGDDTTYDRYAPPALPTRSKRIAAAEHIYLISRLLREVLCELFPVDDPVGARKQHHRRSAVRAKGLLAGATFWVDLCPM